jgi:hypothetical protein
MMNGHGHGPHDQGHHHHPGHGGGAGYYVYGRPPMHYPMVYLMPPHSHADNYNIFSDENPNRCSVM